MNLASAKHAASVFENYWATRGRVVRAIIVSEHSATGNGSTHSFTLRSDPPMVNGYPGKDARASAHQHWRSAAKQLVKGTDQ
jgi:hypothetical protein